jgi:hypothetical protein
MTGWRQESSHRCLKTTEKIVMYSRRAEWAIENEKYDYLGRGTRFRNSGRVGRWEIPEFGTATYRPYRGMKPMVYNTVLILHALSSCRRACAPLSLRRIITGICWPWGVGTRR